MPSTTEAREAKRKDAEIIRYPVAPGVRIPKGCLVCANEEGHAVNGEDSPWLVFLGVAYETVDNSCSDDDASDEEVFIRVQTTGTFVFDAYYYDCGATRIGDRFYILNNHSVTDRTTGYSIIAGTSVAYPSDTEVRIRIDRYAN